MPWGDEDATRHTKKARSSASRHRWSSVANKILDESGDEGKAIRIANAAVKKKHVGVRKKR